MPDLSEPSAVRGHVAPPPRQYSAQAAGMGADDVFLFDRLEQEALLLNIDASLQIQARHQFFGWTQGLLQNLVPHEFLVCALRNADATSFHVDSFVTSAVEPTLISDSFCRDTVLVPHLIKTWEDGQFHPVSCGPLPSSPFAQSSFGQEVARSGADCVLAHGTYDVFGKLVSLFCFACRRESITARTPRFVELIVPFLHLAWTRIRITRPTDVPGSTPAGAVLLTTREQEILKWIHLGKSNIEIGMILGISPLTVKNHVQHILRKLNVQNRAQAVGKGLALRILNF